MYVRRARQAFAAAEINRNDGIFWYLSSVPACYDFECLYIGSGCESVYVESERRARGEREESERRARGEGEESERRARGEGDV